MLLTLAVPKVADPVDAAALVADAAVTSALEVGTRSEWSLGRGISSLDPVTPPARMLFGIVVAPSIGSGAV